MKNISARKVLAWLPPVLWCVVIFLFSSQPGEESMALSSGFVEPILNLVMQVFPRANVALVEEVLTVLIRKGAHCTEYAILAVLTWNAVRQIPKVNPWRLAWGFSAFYAATDELHQYLGGQRTGQWQDVVIDSCGALVGLAVLYEIWKSKRKA